jgi:hypothetical protein
MELFHHIQFKPVDREWEFGIKDEQSVAFIKWKRNNKVDIRIECDPTGTFSERVKKSNVFKDSIAKIKKWEKKRKEELTIDHIEWLGRETEEGKEYHFFGFTIESKVVKGNVVLNGEEENEEHFYLFDDNVSSDAHHFYFVLALEKVNKKGVITFQVDNQFKLGRFYMAKVEKPEPKLFLMKNENKYGNDHSFFTYRFFVEDLAKIIVQHPSIRIKKLLF